MHPIAKRVRAGDARACARAITLIERDDPVGYEILEQLDPFTGQAITVGITGTPGAGKSTLVDALVVHLRQKGLTVGILAVDPTSPFSGGAILGDRVRMQRHALDRNVFIRSMGTRGSLGGLSRHTRSAMKILEAYGSQVILVETVGVGQSEVEVMHVAGSILLLLSPGGGDLVQAFKAGIMEIADLFVVNKADLPGAERLLSYINALLDATKGAEAWRPPVLKAIGTTGEGVPEIWEQILRHQTYLQERGAEHQRMKENKEEEMMEFLRYEMNRHLFRVLSTPSNQLLLRDVRNRKISPYKAALQIMARMKEGGDPE